MGGRSIRWGVVKLLPQEREIERDCNPESSKFPDDQELVLSEVEGWIKGVFCLFS